ncbi:MAG TPA: hypothetical protein VFB99_04540, partial [Vicinamibacterales bacterium]|nr:hypothetical protein [Vicinamibacterales bacterium]
TVNADLRVGQLEETITVTGESPIVDVQSARTQSIIDREVLDAIPSSRNVVGIQAIIRGMNASGDDGGLTGVDAGRSVRDPRRASQRFADPQIRDDADAGGTRRLQPAQRRHGHEVQLRCQPSCPVLPPSGGEVAGFLDLEIPSRHDGGSMIGSERCRSGNLADVRPPAPRGPFCSLQRKIRALTEVA